MARQRRKFDTSPKLEVITAMQIRLRTALATELMAAGLECEWWL